MIRRSAVIALVLLLIGLAGVSSRSIAAPTPTPTPTPTCEDPTPNGGGEMRFADIGQVTHVVTRAGDVCPGASETWTFVAVDLGPENSQSVTVQVVAISGSVAAHVTLPSGSEVQLTPGTPYHTMLPGGTVEVTVAGEGDALATYRVQACRSILSSPCTVSDTVTAKPGDVDCNGEIDSRDAFYILESDAGLVALPCANVAEIYIDGFINSLDAEILLQYAAGLIDQLLPGF